MKNIALNRMKRLNPRQVFAFLLVLVSASFAGCIRECGEDDSITPAILKCETTVTVTPVSCAGGAFQNNWLQLDNGDFLQPFENQTHLTSLEPGKKYRIGYDLMKRDNRYDGQFSCLAMPPASKAIRLLCITPLDSTTTNCNTYVTAKNVICGLGAWGSIWLQLDNGKYLQPWNNNSGLTRLTEGARYKIAYSPMARDSRYNNQFVCEAMPADSLAWNPEVVSVNCIDPIISNANGGK